MFNGKAFSILIDALIFLSGIGAFCTDNTSGDDGDMMMHYLLCGAVVMGAFVQIAVLIFWAP